MTDTLTDEEIGRIEGRKLLAIRAGIARSDKILDLCAAVRQARAERDEARDERDVAIVERDVANERAVGFREACDRAIDERDALRAEVERLRNEEGLTRRLWGCRCQWEEGDSPCPVHPSSEDESPPEPER